MSTDKLHGKDPEIWNKPIPGTVFELTPVNDLVASLTRLHLKGQFNEVDHKKEIPDLEYIKLNNHFQGIQRINQSDYFLLTGASKKSIHAHLFVLQVKSTRGHTHKPIGSNVLNKDVQDYGVLKDIFCLAEDPYWHAGGLSLCGDIMCVPLEGVIENNGLKKDSSRIVFYNMKNPRKPLAYPTEIRRYNQKAGASCLIRMPDKHFHCAVWSDSDDLQKRFDLYRSKTTKLNDGFRKYKRITINQITNRTGREPRFQTIQFMLDKNGRYYLIGFLNTRKTAPVISGVNRLFVYEMELDQNCSVKSLDQVYTRQFDGGGSYYNMGAATGAYVHSNGHLMLYSAHHWKTKKHIRFAEFDQQLVEKNSKITSIKSAQIEFWEHRYFEGRSFILYGDKQLNIPTFKQLKVQGKKFNDKLSSVRILLPQHYKLVLYKHEYYKGDKLTFQGTGKVLEIPKLGKQNDEISSLKIIRLRNS